MTAAAEPPGRRLHVDPAVAAQAHPHFAVVGFEERGDVDAFDRAQVLHDLFGVFAVGAGLSQHRVVDDRPAVAPAVLELRPVERVSQDLDRRKALVGKDLVRDQFLIGAGVDHLGRQAQDVGIGVRMHEGAGVGHDRG